MLDFSPEEEDLEDFSFSDDELSEKYLDCLETEEFLENCEMKIVPAPNENSRFILDLIIGGIGVRALCDSGSTDSFLHPIFRVAMQKKGVKLQPVTGTAVKLADGSIRQIKESVTVPVNTDCSTGIVKFQFLDGLTNDSILGVDAMRALKIVLDFNTDEIYVIQDKKKIPLSYSFVNSVRKVSANIFKPQPVLNCLAKLESKPVKKDLEKSEEFNEFETPKVFQGKKDSPVEDLNFAKLVKMNLNYLAFSVIKFCTKLSRLFKFKMFLTLFTLFAFLGSLVQNTYNLSVHETKRFKHLFSSEKCENTTFDRGKHEDFASFEFKNNSVDPGYSSESDSENETEESMYEILMRQNYSEFKPGIISHADIVDFAKFLEYWRTKFKSVTGITDKIKYKIKLKPGATPVKTNPRPYSPSLIKEAAAKVYELLKKKIIEPSLSAWSFPLVFVAKKNTTERRMCVDFRILNLLTIPVAYPLPRIDSIFDSLGEAYVLSTLDLESGFHQILLDESSKELTSFSIPTIGQFQYRVLPFGLHSAPAIFQNLMDKVLGTLLNWLVKVYLDDILTHGRTYEEHKLALSKVFQRLYDANLKINWKKSTFLRSHVEYLGHIVGQGEIRPAPSKTESVEKFPVPKTITQLQSFLGLASYYRKFIPNFAQKARALYDLLVSNNQPIWDTPQQIAFDELKQSLVSEPILRAPDFNIPFEIHSDASNEGLGAVLVQRELKEGKTLDVSTSQTYLKSIVGSNEFIISYASRSLKKHEKNYSITEKECLSVIFAIEKFRQYIELMHFYVITDHIALKWLQSLEQPTDRLARWVTKLSQYRFTVIHKKGTLHRVPDALSRIPYINLTVNETKETCIVTRSRSDLTPSVPKLQPEENVPEKNTRKPVGLFIPKLKFTYANLKDTWFLSLRTKIENSPESYPKYHVVGPKIYRIWKNHDTNESSHLEVVPKDYRMKLIYAYHNSPLGGHLGAKKTLYNIKKRYFWVNMEVDVSHYVLCCLDCQAYKSKNTTPVNTMSDMPRMMSPGDCFAIDIVGPLPKTYKNNTVILSAIDMSSRYLIAVPLKDAKAVYIVNALLLNLILVFGTPYILLSDNAKNFVGKEFDGFCDLYEIKNHNIPKYSPSANLVERYHRGIKTGLSIYCKNDHRLWDQLLPYVILTINASKNETTGYTPSRLFLNRDIRLPFDLNDFPTFSEFRSKDYVTHAHREAVKMFKKAKDKIEISLTKVAKKFNERRRPHTFRVGDLVWRKNFPQSNADKFIKAGFCPKFVGIFRISEIYSPTQVELVDLQNQTQGRWNVNHLKPFNEG